MMTWTDTLDNGIGLSAYLSFGNLHTSATRVVVVSNFHVTQHRILW